MLVQQGPGPEPMAQLSGPQLLSHQRQGGSFPGLPGPLASHHFLLKTATDSFPANQSLPLFTLAPQNWGFFGPGSPLLLRSGKKRGVRGLAGRGCGGLSSPGELWFSRATSPGTALALMCASSISVHACLFLCQLAFVLGAERSPQGFVLRPRAAGDKWNLQ